MEGYPPPKIITNEIISELAMPGQESLSNENNNLNYENERRIILPQKKIILKNNPSHLKVSNRNEKSELGLTSDENLDHPSPLVSDFNDEGKDLKKIFEQKKIIRGKKIVKSEKLKKKNEGYLEDDLEDDDNKKIYLRVMKRLEKTLGIPVIGARISGESIDDIELEENLKPLLLKDFINDKKNNKIDIYKRKKIYYK